MSQVFISYSHKDKDFVQYLAYRLAEQNVAFWVDDDRLYGGVLWQDEINSGLNTSVVLILVITPDSMASKAVEKEWKYFYDNKKPIISLIIKDTEIADELQKLQWINDFTKVCGFQSGFNKLIRSLQQYDVSVDLEQGWIDYKPNGDDLDPSEFMMATSDYIVSHVRELNHSIRLIFPYKIQLPHQIANYPIHKQALTSLLENQVWHNGFLTDVQSNLYGLESHLVNTRFPYFAKSFLDHYKTLLSSRWIDVMYLDNPEHPQVVATLSPDNTLLNDLFESAKEFSEEINRRFNKTRGKPNFEHILHDYLVQVGLNITGVAFNSFLKPNQNPDNWIKVHCGFVRIDWKHSSTEEENQIAQKIISGFLLEKFWYLSSFK